MGQEQFMAYLIHDAESSSNFILDSRNALHVHSGDTLQLKAHKEKMTVELPAGLFDKSGSHQIPADGTLSLTVSRTTAGRAFTMPFYPTPSLGSRKGPINEDAIIIVDPDED